MFMDVTVSHLVSNHSLLSSSSLLVICSHTQHDDNRCLVMEASQAAASFHLEAIQHSHTSCHTHVQLQLTRGKVSVHGTRSPAWHSLQGQSCSDDIPQAP